MNDWKQVFAAIDAIHTDVSKLLIEADRILATEHYKPRSQNKVGNEASKRIDAPSRWVPGWVSRHYHRPKQPNGPALFVAVLLHNRAGDDLSKLDEPVVTMGVLRDTVKEHWMAKTWAWTDHQHTNGEWEQYSFPDKKGGGRADVCALPLALIDSASKLEKVLRRLVEKATSLSHEL